MRHEIKKRTEVPDEILIMYFVNYHPRKTSHISHLTSHISHRLYSFSGFNGYFRFFAPVRSMVILPTTSSTCAFTGILLLSSVIQRYNLLFFLNTLPGMMVGLNFRQLKVPMLHSAFSLPA